MMTFLETESHDAAERGPAAGVVVGQLVFAHASALDAISGRRLTEAVTIADETRICLERLDVTLQKGGCSLKDLAKVNAYLSEESHSAEFLAACDALLASASRPLRLALVTDLEADTRVMLDAVAVRG
jgi:2-iminobutanoate/2-iminopropanoate deaminase